MRKKIRARFVKLPHVDKNYILLSLEMRGTGTDFGRGELKYLCFNNLKLTEFKRKGVVFKIMHCPETVKKQKGFRNNDLACFFELYFILFDL